MFVDRVLRITEIIRDVELDSGEVEVIFIECESASVVRHSNMPSFGEHVKSFLVYVVDMLEYLKKHPSQGGPEVMEMDRFWHPKMSWYGPAGIGTGRGHRGFRHWHQIPFLNAMPDRGKYVDEIEYHFFNHHCNTG